MSVYHTNDATDSDGTTVSVVQGSPSNGMVTATVTVSGNVPEKLFVKVQAAEN